MTHDDPGWGKLRLSVPEGYIGDLGDGMLAYYQWATQFSDSTVEARLEKEPFDFRNEMLKGKVNAPASPK